MTKGSKFYNRKLTPYAKMTHPLFLCGSLFCVGIWVLITLRVMFCLYLYIARWYIDNVTVMALCHNTVFQWKISFSNRHRSTSIFCCTLAPTSVFYFVYNFVGNVMRNCCRQMKFEVGVIFMWCSILTNDSWGFFYGRLIANYSKLKKYCHFIWLCDSVWFIQASQ